eukprot:3941387-Rhodomonas_salina.4
MKFCSIMLGISRCVVLMRGTDGGCGGTRCTTRGSGSRRTGRRNCLTASLRWGAALASPDLAYAAMGPSACYAMS